VQRSAVSATFGPLRVHAPLDAAPHTSRSRGQVKHGRAAALHAVDEFVHMRLMLTMPRSSKQRRITSDVALQSSSRSACGRMQQSPLLLRSGARASGQAEQGSCTRPEGGAARRPCALTPNGRYDQGGPSACVGRCRPHGGEDGEYGAVCWRIGRAPVGAKHLSWVTNDRARREEGVEVGGDLVRIVCQPAPTHAATALQPQSLPVQMRQR
jgi:hypothetical protein